MPRPVVFPCLATETLRWFRLYFTAVLEMGCARVREKFCGEIGVYKPLTLPSFKLLRYRLRNLHHGRQELIFTSAGQLPRPFEIRQDLAV